MAEFNRGAWLTVEEMKRMDAERELTPEEKIVNVAEKVERSDEVFDVVFDINLDNVKNKTDELKSMKDGVKKEFEGMEFDDLDEGQKDKLIKVMSNILGLI